MAFERLTDNLNKVVERLEDYGTSTAEYYKLRLFKSAMKFSTSLVNMLVIGFIAFLFLIFISIGGALYLSSVIGNSFSGFLIIGGLYLVVLLLVIFVGKGFIEQRMLLKFSDLLIEDDEYDPKEIAKQNFEEERIEDILEEESMLTTINDKSTL